jgi:hypothetical protein
MNIYAFPLPGDPVIRPETRDEMVDRMAAEALQWVRKRCAELSAEYEPLVTAPLAGLEDEMRAMFNDMARAGSQMWWNRQRDAALGVAASGNPWNGGGQLAQRGALF